jgi:hypothetical protein
LQQPVATGGNRLSEHDRFLQPRGAAVRRFSRYGRRQTEPLPDRQRDTMSARAARHVMQPTPLTAIFLALLVLVVSLGAPGARAQASSSEDPFADLSVPGPGAEPAKPPQSQLAFVLLGEIALPGPLPGAAPRWTGSRIEIPVAGGIAALAPDPGAIPELLPAAAPEPAADAAAAPDRWTVDSRGRLRFGPLDGGFVVAEKRCNGCASGWKRRWKLRVPGSGAAPPLVHRGRVFFSALDNRIYCVKARNGHRVWAADVGGRVSERLVLAAAPPGKGEKTERDVVLAVPDDGSQLLGLDAKSGVQLARATFGPDEGSLVGVPLTVPGGKIAVARQKYTETEASLLLYRLVEPEPVEEDPGSAPTTTTSTSPARTS